MKTDQVSVEPENIEKAVKRTETVQKDLDGETVPEVKGLLCPFSMTECLKTGCTIWHRKLGNCNFAFIGEIMENVRAKH